VHRGRDADFGLPFRRHAEIHRIAGDDDVAAVEQPRRFDTPDDRNAGAAEGGLERGDLAATS